MLASLLCLLSCLLTAQAQQVVLITGGDNSPATQTSEIYDPASGAQCSLTSEFPDKRFAHTQVTSTALYNIPPSVFWTSVRTWMDPTDLPFMLVKALVFGLIIAVIACGWGLTTKGGPKEVGTSTTGAVVMILVTVALMDTVLTQLLFG